jgi:thiamine biosynthesis protein ThiC
MKLKQLREIIKNLPKEYDDLKVVVNMGRSDVCNGVPVEVIKIEKAINYGNDQYITYFEKHSGKTEVIVSIKG